MNRHASLATAACLALALEGAVLTAHAHTTIRSQATESVTEDNAARIGHGCETSSGDHRPVIAQSVVFPSVAPILTASDSSPVAHLAAVIEQGTLAGLIRGVQDRSIFQQQQMKRDENGNAIGFSATYGMLDPNFQGRVPFQFVAPKFVANSCAKRLLIKVGIADICARGADSVRPGKVNLWIPSNGSSYATQAQQFGVDGVGSPATLTVNRNLTANPLPASCGAGIDVTVEPNPVDIDIHLPIPGYWQ